MTKYHKIQSLYKRDPDTKFKTLLEGEYSIPEFWYLKDTVWQFTEKVDGTNIRIIWHPETEVIEFKGRTDNAQIPPRLLEALNARFLNPMMLAALKEFDKETVFYGEGYGDRIQKVGRLYREDNSFCLFDVKVGDTFLERSIVVFVAGALRVEVAPNLGFGTLDDLVARCKERFKSHWGDFDAEGIVARPAIELKTRLGERIITKLKFKDFPRAG